LASRSGKNLHFGIREHAMAATLNGLSLSKLRAFGATFFIFSDDARPAIRLSALMELPTIFIFTHDAMGDGEDGPTHQPVEQLLSLRAIPGLVTLRPGDANEVVEAYNPEGVSPVKVSVPGSDPVFKQGAFGHGPLQTRPRTFRTS
jgi:transketolase